MRTEKYSADITPENKAFLRRMRIKIKESGGTFKKWFNDEISLLRKKYDKK